MYSSYSLKQIRSRNSLERLTIVSLKQPEDQGTKKKKAAHRKDSAIVPEQNIQNIFTNSL